MGKAATSSAASKDEPNEQKMMLQFLETLSEKERTKIFRYPFLYLVCNDFINTIIFSEFFNATSGKKKKKKNKEKKVKKE